jgi:hypothetical protein
MSLPALGKAHIALECHTRQRALGKNSGQNRLCGVSFSIKDAVLHDKMNSNEKVDKYKIS